MPIVAPGESGRGLRLSAIGVGLVRNRSGLLLPPARKGAGNRLIVKGQHACRHKSSVDGTGLADGERADGHACRHLNDGQEAVVSL